MGTTVNIDKLRVLITWTESKCKKNKYTNCMYNTLIGASERTCENCPRCVSDNLQRCSLSDQVSKVVR